MLEAKVRDIQIQPMKGGGPLGLEEARITFSGLETEDGRIQDHFLVAVTSETDSYGDHNFLTQRVQVDPNKDLFTRGAPELALARPESRDGTLVYHFDDSNEVTVPDISEDDQNRIIPVQVWEYRGGAIEVPILSEWLSDCLQRNVLVARTSGPWDRKARQNFMKNENPLRAQDGYPVHAINWEDAAKVFEAIGAEVDPNRFRYQVLLEGLPFRRIHDYAWGEINDIHVAQPKPCGRCEVTGIDQQTGKFSNIKPLAGLARLQVGRWIRSEKQKEHVMGENWLPQGETIIRKGDIFMFTELRKSPLDFEVPSARR
ncbi:MOSC domain-containing protein [Candidatus Roizmanbacteria bacterium]|nr:MOSC domain-containing protein [Candidatus Roizmanbacteria bacterium]